MATVNEVKLMNNGEMVTPVTLAGSVKNLDGSSTIDGLMKKVADSDLDMNGNDIINPISIQSQVLGFNRSVIVPVPRISYENLGVASGDNDNFFKAYLKKIAELHPTKRRTLFIGTLNASGWSNAISYIHDCSDLGSDGVPKYATCMTHSYLEGDFIVKTDANGNITVNRISQYSATDTTKDNRINAFGSNYIRYENGLQICWGEFTITNTIDTASGNVYARTINMQHSYPVTFKTGPQAFVQSAHNLDGTKSREIWVGDVYTYTNKIFGIRISSPVPITDTIDLKFNYFAIGTWK